MNNTRIKAGLIGSPLKQSLSPRIFKSLLPQIGGKYSYTLLETGESGLGQTLKTIGREGWAGFNVTLPLKEKIIPFLDALSPESEAIGAVNAVRIKNGKLEGHNTDTAAMKLTLREAGCRLRGRTCVIWGAGGAARAAAWILASGGAGAVHIHNRSVLRADGLMKGFSRIFPRTKFAIRKFTEAPAAAATVFVNATPLGMYGPLAENLRFNGPPGSVYLDFTYDACSRSLTPFLQNRAGKTISGIDLLIYQALKSAELYSERPITAGDIVKLKDRIKAQLRKKG